MIEPSPFASSVTVTSCVAIVGAVVSTTVTVEVAVAIFPERSVTVNVTVFAPRFEQSNEVTSSDNATEVQSSLEPLSMSAVVIDPWPFTSSVTVTSWVIAVGGTSSITVTIAVVVDSLPYWSSAVRVTILSPTSAQANSELSMYNVISSSQASFDPLLMSAGEILAW